MEEKSILKQIEINQSLQDSKREYVVRGAIVKCSNGEKTAVLNLPKDHGEYIQGRPQIDVQDSKIANIQGFGKCKITGEKCIPELSIWLNGKNENQMFDGNTLNHEASVPFMDAYCICTKYGAVVDLAYSGQIIHKSIPKKVYITDDRKAIVANNITFQIHNPCLGVVMGPLEKWETILEYEVTKTEIDIVKAILGFSFNASNLSRKELTIDAYGTEWSKKGKPRATSKSIQVIDSVPKSGSNIQKNINKMYGFQVGLDILTNIANAIEKTYVNFYFEKSNLENHRVTIMAGTGSEFWKYYNYEYFDRDRSLVYDVFKEVNYFMNYESLNDYFRYIIEKYLIAIEKGESNAKLLVKEEKLWLKKGEHYDLTVRLSSERRLKRYQVYLFSRDKKMSQKIITFPNESMAIVKRSGYNGKITKLIELIDVIITTEGNDKFWLLFEKALEDANDKKSKVKLADIID